MESLGRLQFNLNATIINKAHSNFKKTPKDRITVPYVETRLEALEATWATFKTTHQKIIAETKTCNYEHSDYHKRELYEVPEELYIDYKTELKESLLNLTTKKVVFNQSDKKQKVSGNENWTYCSEEHELSNCNRFAKLEVNAWRDFAQSRRLCFNCLRKYHPRYSCHQNTHREKTYHSLPYQSQPQKSEEGVAKTVKPATFTRSETSNAEPAALGSAVCCHQQVLLATALVNAQSSTGTAAVLKSLIDQGSRTSFITESAVQLLGLKKIPRKGIVSGIGGGKSTLALTCTRCLAWRMFCCRKQKQSWRRAATSTAISGLKMEAEMEAAQGFPHFRPDCTGCGVLRNNFTALLKEVYKLRDQVAELITTLGRLSRARIL